MRVDADAHVDETEATWEFLDGPGERFRPITLDPGAATVPNDQRPHRLWLIDGYPRLRRWRDDERTATMSQSWLLAPWLCMTVPDTCALFAVVSMDKKTPGAKLKVWRLSEFELGPLSRRMP